MCPTSLIIFSMNWLIESPWDGKKLISELKEHRQYDKLETHSFPSFYQVFHKLFSKRCIYYSSLSTPKIKNILIKITLEMRCIALPLPRTSLSAGLCVQFVEHIQIRKLYWNKLNWSIKARLDRSHSFHYVLRSPCQYLSRGREFLLYFLIIIRLFLSLQ